MPVERLYFVLGTSGDGLSSSQAKKRLEENGPNLVSEKKAIPPFLRTLISQFENWLVIALILAAILSFFLGERLDALIVISIVVISVLFGFLQEYRAEVALNKLKKFISNRIYVKRDGLWQEIESRDIVVGDLVRLQMGNLVPADIRLSVSKDLSVDEAVLTGESFPVEKIVGRVMGGDSLSPQDIKNMVFMGTSVVGGYGEGIVVAVGNDTFFGKTAFYLEKSAPETDFEKQTRRFSAFLFRVIILMASFVFLVNSLSGKGTVDSFLFAVALAVGITPELLPAIMTITLSQGALAMAKNKVVVKRLMSVENFGNMDTLCTDKTGTLTEGAFSLTDYVDLNGERREEILIKSLLCTTNFFYGEGTKSTNPVDQALWNSSKSLHFKDRLNNYQFLDQIGFDFKTRRMITLVKDEKGKKLLIAKGSPESILSICDISSQEKKLFFEKVKKYEEDGVRVIAVAQSLTDGKSVKVKENRFLFLGFLLFSDPVKVGVKDTLDVFKKLGVQIKILSGDSLVVTRSVANEVGLDVKDEDIVTGETLEGLSDSQLEEYARKYNFFARVTPEIKYKIVASLNREGHIVGFLGDGVNDAPAIKAADVGIAVDTGTLIAKDAADIVLLKKDLRLLASGVEMSRKTFGNVMKYILNTVSANYGNMLTVAASSLFLSFIPLLPKQILLNNFISDMPLFAVATDNVDPEFTKRPRRWNIKLIGNFMLFFGLISSFFDLMLILPMIYVWKFSPEVFRTAWFLESALSEMIVTFAIRTQRPFFKSSPSKLLILSTVFCVVGAVLLVILDFGHKLFEFTTMPIYLWGWIGVVLVSYFILTEIVKLSFFKKYDL